MKITYKCPHAKTGKEMKVICSKTDQLCAFQFFMRCKGWYQNTDMAQQCLLREEKK
jgi:hypothetical protein